MNKYLKLLLFFILIGSNLNARSNKTHDLSRPYGVNLAMEYTTWNEFMQTKVKKDQFGLRFQATPFYQQSDTSDNFGCYFGVNNKHKFIIGYNSDDTIQKKYAVNSRYIFHDATSPANRKATIVYEPDQEAYGLRLDFFQCLSRWVFKGLHAFAALPIVHVKNDMRLQVEDVENITKKQVYDFYEGQFKGFNDSNDKQKELHHAKIHHEKSTTQLADVDLILAYRFVETPEYHICIDLGLTIPTSNKTHGIWVFEPMGGNGDHWAFGGGLDFRMNLWTGKKQNVKFESTVKYRYLFENHERRTLQLTNVNYKDDNGVQHTIPTEYSQYFLLAELGQENKPLIPAANILTRPVNVTPRSQVDAIFAVAYNNRNFRSELGLNIFWKDCEKVLLREKWDGGTYYLAKPEFDTTQKFVATNGYVLNKDNIDVTAASTPAQVASLKFYGGLGYIFKEWKHPMLLSAAAHYEWADQTDGGIQNWGIWGKIGFGF
jgi:hypothetical protein